MKKLSNQKMENIEGGVPVAEYCGTLWGILTGGGYQGDILWGWEVYASHCVS